MTSVLRPVASTAATKSSLSHAFYLALARDIDSVWGELMDLRHERTIGTGWLRGSRDHRNVQERAESGDHLDISAQVGDRDILDRLEQAGLMVEQQDQRVGRIHERYAPTCREHARFFGRRFHRCFPVRLSIGWLRRLTTVMKCQSVTFRCLLPARHLAPQTFVLQA